MILELMFLIWIYVIGMVTIWNGYSSIHNRVSKTKPARSAGELLFKRALQLREFAVAKEVRDGSGEGPSKRFALALETSAFEMVPSPSQSPRPKGEANRRRP